MIARPPDGGLVNPSARPTLRDVAAEAGVSTMTVSNVLNGHHGRASPATVRRVMAAVEQLGYVPNAQARALSGRQSKLIAMLYPPGAYASPALANPHDAIFVSEVERHATDAGLHLLVHAAADVNDAAASLRGWQVDGAIFLRTFGEEVETVRERHELPIVFVDNYSRSPLVSNLGIDDHRGGWLAADHLARAGHRRIGFIAPQFHLPGVVRQRYLGFVAGLASHGLALDPADVTECNATFEEGIAVATRLAGSPDRPSALFATADLLAAGLMKGFLTHGVSVPGEVSLVGFDDLPVCRQLTPELTTIRQDITAKARATIELLQRLVEEWPEMPAERTELDVTLIERGSVARCPSSPEPDVPLRRA
jgi:LacI family transcriptional regulator